MVELVAFEPKIDPRVFAGDGPNPRLEVLFLRWLATFITHKVRVDDILSNLCQKLDVNAVPPSVTRVHWNSECEKDVVHSR